MIKTQLAKAISIAVAGIALSSAASTASAHTMYNTFSATGPLATDGWTHIADEDVYRNGVLVAPKDGIGTGPESKGHLGLIVPWSGTTGGALPFGYTGSAHLNWAAAVHHLGTMEVSTADAIEHYGLSAEIDTGAGAWKDGPNVTGWKHQTDLGLIKTDFDTTIRLNLTTLGSFNNNFGVTVFKGMDTTTGDYSHHGGWNSASKPETTSNPFYAAGVGSGMEYLTHDATVDSVNYIEFFAQADQVYTIALGGNGVGHWAQNVADYKLSITAVPVPGAVWLFGSAIAGLISFGRRKVA